MGQLWQNQLTCVSLKSGDTITCPDNTCPDNCLDNTCPANTCPDNTCIVPTIPVPITVLLIPVPLIPADNDNNCPANTYQCIMREEIFRASKCFAKYFVVWCLPKKAITIPCLQYFVSYQRCLSLPDSPNLSSIHPHILFIPFRLYIHRTHI